MAEELAAEHMRQVGFINARRTPAGNDSGVDVIATYAVAQVKFQAAPVGGPLIQQLRGAAHDIESALFYSSSGYTRAAAAAAERCEVALFRFTTRCEVFPQNSAAQQIVDRDSAKEDAQIFEQFTTAMNSFYAWVDAIKELSAAGRSPARQVIGETRLLEVSDAVEAAMAGAMTLRSYFDRGTPIESRAKIWKAIAVSQSATAAFGEVVMALPEPYATRYEQTYAELYLKASADRQ